MILFLFVGVLVLGLLCFLLHKYLQRRNKAKSFIFYIGLIYLGLGIPLLFGFTIVFGVIFCLLGILNLILSHFNLPKPLISIILIFPLLLFLGYNFHAQSSNNIFLIPKGYVGRILIVHGCKDGISKEFEGTSRIYRIPRSGILKTKFNFAGSSFDYMNTRYYYVDEQGVKTEILDDITTIHPHALWTLPHERKGDTIIDFIIDTHQKDPNNYKSEEFSLLQKEIDSCSR